MWRACGCMLLIVALSLVWVQPLNGQDGAQHVVQPGENLFRIALQYGVAVDVLMRANGLSSADVVVVGQTLLVPGDAAMPAADPTQAYPAGSRLHSVQAGENLLRIAQYYAITPEALMHANSILDPDHVIVGQVLLIPSDGPSSDLGLLDVRPLQLNLERDMPPPSDPALPAVQVERDPDADAPDLGIVAEQVSAARSKPEGAETLVTEPVDEAPRDERQVAARPAPSAEVAALSDASPEHPPEAGGGASAMAPDGVEASDPAAIIPDLGIIAAGGPAWLLQPTLVTTGSPQVRAIFERGQELGNDPHAFSKIGDCNSEPPFFLARFDGSGYDLGPYAGLQFVVDHFAGSFARASMAAWTGNHAWAVFEPLWANPSQCLAGETPIACEFRVQRPSVALIALGTNEVGSSALFEENLRAIVEYSIEHGVIPVLGTKADQLEGSDLHNEIIRALAEEYGIPLWDFGRAAEMLPGRGLQADGFHLTYVEPYYTQPAALQSGHAVHNLTALMALDAVWRSVIREQP